MPYACSCCHHRQRVLIDLALDQQQPLRTIQTRWGVSRSALLHHRDCCLRPRRLRRRNCFRPLASEPDVKVSLHPAQAWNNAPGWDCGPALTGRGFDTVRPLACTCLWQLGWIRTRFSALSVPPSVL
jgi:hypothetical protein